MSTDYILMGCLTTVGLFIIIAVFIFCRRRWNRKSNKKLNRQSNVNPTSSSDIQSISAISQAPGASHNGLTERFAVPRDLLPRDFDYGAPSVQDMGDYVLITDLTCLRRKSGVSLEEYKTQAPYNPNY